MRRAAYLTAVLIAGIAMPAVSEEASPELQNWLVGTHSEPKLEALRKKTGARAVHKFESFRGYAAQMTEAEAEALRSSPEVRFVEPDYERHLYRTRPLAGPRVETTRVQTSAITGQSVPFGIDAVRARQLWQYSRGGTIRVAVIDTGIDYNHPDLRKVRPGRSRLASRPVGRDFVNDDHDPIDDHGHGTHVAGTIAALDNAFGVVGVAPDVELYALKVLRPNAQGNATGPVSGIIKAVDWAIANGIHVMNLSLGSDTQSTAEREAFARAWDAGVLAVAATGNDYDGIDGIGYPAGYPNVIAVGAVDACETIASFSQRGTGIALVAPGVEILSSLSYGVASEHNQLSVAAGPDFSGEHMEESARTSGVSGDLVDGGLCDSAGSWSGKVVLCERGEITFHEKIENVRIGGGIAAVVFNNVCGSLLGTCNGGTGTSCSIPAIGITQSDGLALKEHVNARSTLISDLTDEVTPYGVMQGTSMATPHVTGVAALIWSLTPDATANQVREALVQGAKDLGASGWDSTHGFGLVDAVEAARIFAPHLVP